MPQLTVDSKRQLNKDKRRHQLIYTYANKPTTWLVWIRISSTFLIRLIHLILSFFPYILQSIRSKRDERIHLETSEGQRTPWELKSNAGDDINNGSLCMTVSLRLCGKISIFRWYWTYLSNINITRLSGWSRWTKVILCLCFSRFYNWISIKYIESKMIFKLHYCPKFFCVS